MYNIVDNHPTKAYLQARHQQTYEFYSQMHKAQGIKHYAINSLLYLRTIKDKYIEIYNKFISQLHIYAKAVRTLAKDCSVCSILHGCT